LISLVISIVSMITILTVVVFCYRYLGCDRSMLIPNTLFRIGGAAIVLTNKASLRSQCKYELQHVVRIHMGKDDKAYQYALGSSVLCPLR
jgi:hypothetical protein